MQIENSFDVNAPAAQVFDFLLDVNRVARCVPGAELGEVVDPSTFTGRVRIKVGPVTVAYSGTARIRERDDTSRRAVLEAEGRETTGPGSARSTSVMLVAESGEGSNVRITTDYTVAGRVAQFGRGVMEDVSRRLVGQMAACIKAELERTPEPALQPPADAAAPAAVQAAGPAGAGSSASPAPPAPQPVNALSLLFSVLLERLKRLFSPGRGRPPGLG